jgi:CheY-like chemotaxis protein
MTGGLIDGHNEFGKNLPKKELRMQSQQLSFDVETMPKVPMDLVSHHGANQDKRTFLHRILVVDDDTTIMHLLAELLEKLGYNVDMAENGPRALDKISSCRYDLIITDLEMPAMNGFYLATKAKNVSRAIKAVIMTGRCQAEVADLAATAVADAWLFKPFGLNELCGVIDGLAQFEC